MNDINEEVVNTQVDEVVEHSDTKPSNDSSNDSSGDTKPLIALANVDIDESKYSYTSSTIDKYVNDVVPWSIYNAIGRDGLDSIIDELTGTIKYNEMLLRSDTPLNAQEKKDLIDTNTRLKKALDPYIVVRDSLSVAASGIDGLLDKKGDYKGGIKLDEHTTISGKLPKIDLSRSDNPDVFLTVLTSALGSATEIRIPLPASGFSITLCAPSKPEIIGMVSRITRIEQKIARSLIGYTFSAQVSETLREILNLFLSPNKIKRCSLDVPHEDLLKYIKRADIDILLGHFSWLMYPTGYNYILNCFNYVNVKTGIDDEVHEKQCDYFEQATVNILDMIWYDNSRLTTDQRYMLASAKHTVEQITKYQKISDTEYLSPYNRIELTPVNKGTDPDKYIESIIIYLKSPSIEESLALEDKWLIKLDNYIDNVGGAKLSDENLENIASSLSSSMIISMYTAYVDKIEMIYFDNSCGERSTTTNSDPNTISSILEAASSNSEYGDIIGAKINDYIERLKIGIMGVPNKRCPKCQLPQPYEIEGTKLIPVNPLKDFFTVCRIKIM